MKLTLGTYTVVGEAAADGSWVLLEEATALSRMLQRELLAPTQGVGIKDIYRDDCTDRIKEDNGEGVMLARKVDMSDSAERG